MRYLLILLFCSVTAGDLHSAEKVTFGEVVSLDTSQSFPDAMYDYQQSGSGALDSIYFAWRAVGVSFVHIEKFERTDRRPLAPLVYEHKPDLSFSDCPIPREEGGAIYAEMTKFLVSPNDRWAAWVWALQRPFLYTQGWEEAYLRIEVFDLQDVNGTCAPVLSQSFQAGDVASLFFTEDSENLVVGLPYMGFPVGDPLWGRTSGQAGRYSLNADDNWTLASMGQFSFEGFPNQNSLLGHSAVTSRDTSVLAIFSAASRLKESESISTTTPYFGFIPENSIRAPNLPTLTIVEGANRTDFTLPISEGWWNQSWEPSLSVGKGLSITPDGDTVVLTTVRPEADALYTSSKSAQGWGDLARQEIDLGDCISAGSPPPDYSIVVDSRLSNTGQRLAIVGARGFVEDGERKEYPAICLLTRSSATWRPLRQASQELTDAAQSAGLTNSIHASQLQSNGDLSRLMWTKGKTSVIADLTWEPDEPDIPIGALMLLLQRNSDEEE